MNVSESYDFDNENNIGRKIILVSKTIQHAFDLELRDKVGITGAQWRALSILATHNGITQKEIADKLGLDTSSLIPLIDRLESGQIKKLNVLTGLYFKAREISAYATLLEGIQRNNQKYVACKNHTKIILFQIGDNYYTIEGSANFSSNPRIEQYNMINDRQLYEFHKQWMDDILINA